MSLNPEQKAAVERTGQDICVVAGPGTGKTRVLIERFAWLVRERGIAPGQILALTFTEKAATEIKSRLAAEFGGDGELRQRIERADVATIDGFCTRLLRRHAIAAGVDVDFGVLEEGAAERLLRQAAVEILDELLAEEPHAVRRLMESVAVSSRSSERADDLPDALGGVYTAIRVAGKTVRELLGPPPRVERLAPVLDAVAELTGDASQWTTAPQKERLAALREWLAEAEALAPDSDARARFLVLRRLDTRLTAVPAAVKPAMRELKDALVPRVRAGLIGECYSSERELLIEVLARLERRHRELKRAEGGLDFADLEERALRLLESNGAVRESVREQYDYILMDELQDTNPLQWRIVDRIRRPERFFAVGDINQSIYGFRHAEPAAFEEYARSVDRPGQTLDRLVKNYRSRQEILDRVAWLTGGQPGLADSRLKAERAFDELRAPAVEVMIAEGSTKREAALREARWIAHQISGLIGEGLEPDKIAVLGRKMRSLVPIAEALREIGIASNTTGGRTLYETRETRDLALLLGVMGNVHDEVSLAGLLRSPLVGCSDETLLRLKMLRDGLWEGLAAACEEAPVGIAEEELERVRWITRLLWEVRERREADAPDRLVTRVLDESGYLAGLDAQGRANVERYLRMLRERYAGTGRSLAEAAQETARARSEAPEAEAPAAEAVNAVRLMSIHKSKGLEFPVVFVPAMEGGTSGRIPAICRSPSHGIGVRWVEPDGTKGAGDSGYEEVKEAEKRKRDEEEWRLLYVAMTRAESRLFLSWAQAERSRRSAWAQVVQARIESDGEGQVAHAVRGSDPEPLERSTGRSQERGPEQLDPAEVRGQEDSSVAVTEVGTFLECPRKHYLTHYLGFREEDGRRSGGEEEDAFEPYPEEESPVGGKDFGTEVHRLLAGMPVEDPDPEAVRLVEEFGKSKLAGRLRAAAVCEREFGFLMELEGVILRGQIDFWFEEDGKLVVGDYKTDRFDPGREPERLRRYELQLRLYALALERREGRLPDEAVLHFVRSGKTVPVSLDEGELEAARECVRALLRAEDRMDFPLREGERRQCCGHFGGRCPAGNTAMIGGVW